MVEQELPEVQRDSPGVRAKNVENKGRYYCRCKKTKRRMGGWIGEIRKEMHFYGRFQGNRSLLLQKNENPPSRDRGSWTV